MARQQYFSHAELRKREKEKKNERWVKMPKPLTCIKQGKNLSSESFSLPTENVSILKRKKFAPIGSKFFPFRVDPFQNGTGVGEAKQEGTKVVSLV